MIDEIPDSWEDEHRSGSKNYPDEANAYFHDGQMIVAKMDDEEEFDYWYAEDGMLINIESDSISGKLQIISAFQTDIEARIVAMRVIHDALVHQVEGSA